MTRILSTTLHAMAVILWFILVPVPSAQANDCAVKPWDVRLQSMVLTKSGGSCENILREAFGEQ